MLGDSQQSVLIPYFSHRNESMQHPRGLKSKAGLQQCQSYADRLFWLEWDPQGITITKEHSQKVCVALVTLSLPDLWASGTW